jgi:hypothetical protein
MGACRVEAGRAGVDDLDEAVPPGPEAGQVRWGGRKEEQVVAGSRQRDAIRIALAEGGPIRSVDSFAQALADERASRVRDVEHRAAALERKIALSVGRGWRQRQAARTRLDELHHVAVQEIGHREGVLVWSAMRRSMA